MFGHRDTQGRCHGMMEADAGVTHPQPRSDGTTGRAKRTYVTKPGAPSAWLLTGRVTPLRSLQLLEIILRYCS